MTIVPDTGCHHVWSRFPGSADVRAEYVIAWRMTPEGSGIILEPITKSGVWPAAMRGRAWEVFEESEKVDQAKLITAFAKPPPEEQPKRRPGRPTNAEREARARQKAKESGVVEGASQAL